MEEHSLQTYVEHTYCVYSTIWSPSRDDVFASVSGDGSMKIWDAKGAFVGGKKM